jgi:hypothetical protein
MQGIVVVVAERRTEFQPGNVSRPQKFESERKALRNPPPPPPRVEKAISPFWTWFIENPRRLKSS